MLVQTETRILKALKRETGTTVRVLALAMSVVAPEGADGMFNSLVVGTLTDLVQWGLVYEDKGCIPEAQREHWSYKRTDVGEAVARRLEKA